MAEGKMLSMEEVDRYSVIQRVLDRRLSKVAAAVELGLSVRHVKRLCVAVRNGGVEALVSKKRGIPSNRRIEDSVREKFVQLVAAQYADFGPALAAEYLRHHHGFGFSVETLRSWMMKAGLWQAKVRRAKRVHLSRPRRPRLGELVQIDGSHHDWFEGRGDKCCLIAFIDDATSIMLGARFFAQETTVGYLSMLHNHVQTKGRPLAYYSDRHGIFTKHNPEDNKPTQFERALLQLQIEGIQARTPQAKGRVERLFQTLQDRMCKAMRVAQISDMAAANLWLPSFIDQHNKRFKVAPLNPEDAHRRFVGTAQELLRICAIHEQRQLNAALNCQFECAILQVNIKQAGLPKARSKVDIVQHLDGSLELLYRNEALAFKSYGLGHNKATTQDEKTLNQHVDHLVTKEKRRSTQLLAQLAHEQDQRDNGIFHPTSHTSGLPQYAMPTANTELG